MTGSGEREENNDEQQPLLHRSSHSQLDAGEGGDSRELIQFDEEDKDNPKQWSRRDKLMNMGVIAFMAVMSPLASSMFTPGIDQIADGLDTTVETVIGCTTGFVIMLGVGPLILAPLSETFGRRILYLTCYTMCTHSKPKT